MTFRCLPTTKAEAKRLGLAYFDNGKPCRYGHEGIRGSSNSGCMRCSRIRRKLTAGYKERTKRRAKEWKKKNPERAAYINRVSLLKNWDKASKRQRDYFQRTKGQSLMRRLAANARRRAARRGAEGHHTAKDISALFTAQRGFCVGPCGRALRVFGYHVDHKTPLSRGGSNWPDNLQLLCPKCNGSKGTKTDDEWRSTFVHT